eukprot:365735-Chlamydomonas_euryale.AAC.3
MTKHAGDAPAHTAGLKVGLRRVHECVCIASRRNSVLQATAGSHSTCAQLACGIKAAHAHIVLRQPTTTPPVNLTSAAAATEYELCRRQLHLSTAYFTRLGCG